MTASPPALTSRLWFGKVSAALILGFTASLALTCLYTLLSGVKDPFFDARGQIAMWMIAPLWSGFLSFCFLFRTGARAWGWLFLANIILWGAYGAARIIQS